HHPTLPQSQVPSCCPTYNEPSDDPTHVLDRPSGTSFATNRTSEQHRRVQHTTQTSLLRQESACHLVGKEESTAASTPVATEQPPSCGTGRGAHRLRRTREPPHPRAFWHDRMSRRLDHRGHRRAEKETRRHRRLGRRIEAVIGANPIRRKTKLLL